MGQTAPEVMAIALLNQHLARGCVSSIYRRFNIDSCCQYGAASLIARPSMDSTDAEYHTINGLAIFNNTYIGDQNYLYDA